MVQDCGRAHSTTSRTQVFFWSGKYPKEDVIRRVLHALRASGASAHPVPLTALRGQVPEVGLSKLRMVISRFEEELAWRRIGLTSIRSDDHLLADGYSQTARCRWRVFLETFTVPVSFERWGHCDNCERSRGAAL